MKLPKICSNKFFLIALGASFTFSMFLYNVSDNSIHDVKGDFVTKADKIEQKLDINNVKIENILISQARIEQKIDNLRP